MKHVNSELSLFKEALGPRKFRVSLSQLILGLGKIPSFPSLKRLLDSSPLYMLWT